MEYIIFQSILFASAMASGVGYVHMLQLEGYQTDGYFRWMKTRAGEAAFRMLPVFLSLILIPLAGGWAVWGCSALLLLPPWLRHRKVKKPLALTSRVVRLLAALALLFGASTFLVWLPEGAGRLRLLIPTALYALLPFWVLVAHFVTLPIQKAVNNRYLRDAKRRLASHPSLTVIGVTGSYGKTSVKNILSALLSVRWNVCATPESFNTPMGVVRTVRGAVPGGGGLDATHEMFICEMGARRKGEIKELCDIASPKHGIVTAIGPMHLETFGSIETVASTKCELFDALPPDGTAFLCSDDPMLRERKPANAVTYGLDPAFDPDYRADGIAADASGTRFTVHTRDGRAQEFTTALLGAHQVLNLLAGIAVADTLGAPMNRLPAAVRTIRPVPHRLQLIPGRPITYIDDAFNSNPAGAKAALDVLAMLDGLKILVTPGMVELGPEQDTLNRAFGVQAAAVCDHVALIGRRQTAPIAEGLSEAGYPGEKLKVYETLKEATDWVKTIQGHENIYVLLENDLPDNY